MIRRSGNQRGGALIVVMMVGLVITIGLAGFITSSLATIRSPSVHCHNGWPWLPHAHVS